MEELKTNETVIEQPDETKVVENQVEEVKQPSKTELLRELSKEHGINLFDAKGIQEFKDFQESQKTEAEKMQEQLDNYKSKTEQYEVQLAAFKNGISEDRIQDAVALAKNRISDNESIADGFSKLKESYPELFGKAGKSKTTNIQVGTQINDVIGSTQVDKPQGDFLDAWKKIKK